MFIEIYKRKKGEEENLRVFLTQFWFNGRYPADFAFCYELHLKIYTVLIHRDLLACVVVNICHKSTWLWPTESTHPCHYKVSTCVGYCVACYYQELRGLNNQPLFEKWAPSSREGQIPDSREQWNSSLELLRLTTQHFRRILLWINVLKRHDVL